MLKIERTFGSGRKKTASSICTPAAIFHMIDIHQNKC
ncbi:hypothetical protein BSNT_07597 [Bacillus subtilis subsp. natto BEST195]|nr:hypothetical protein BSNT_07597 [Bacillus subtilis subsp. natto BEST195]